MDGTDGFYNCVKYNFATLSCNIVRWTGSMSFERVHKDIHSWIDPCCGGRTNQAIISVCYTQS